MLALTAEQEGMLESRAIMMRATIRMDAKDRKVPDRAGFWNGLGDVTADVPSSWRSVV
jgi:hypothetical protein